LADIEQKPGQNDARSAAREEYARPKLRVFGQVGALTQSGSGLDAEKAMDMGMMAEMKQRP